MLIPRIFVVFAFAVVLATCARAADATGGSVCSYAKLDTYARTTCEPLDRIVELSLRACEGAWIDEALKEAGPLSPDASVEGYARWKTSVDKWLASQQAYFLHHGEVVAIEARSRAGKCGPR